MWPSAHFSRWKGAVQIFALCVMLVGCDQNESARLETHKYSRSDCIVRVDFDWTDIPEHEERLNMLLTIGDEMIENFDDLSIPEASFSPDLTSANQIYLQFAKECERKAEFAEMHISRALSTIGSRIHFTVSDETIEPSESTIDVKGPSWSD